MVLGLLVMYSVKSIIFTSRTILFYNLMKLQPSAFFSARVFIERALRDLFVRP